MAPSNKRANSFVQQSLFDDIPVESPEGTTELVRITASSEDGFTPQQKKFNILARKIERLRGDIEVKTAAYNEILAFWSKHHAPIGLEVANHQIRLAFAIETQANGFKLGVRQTETVGFAITGLLNDAFSRNMPETEAQDLFSRWNDVSFEEELSGQEDEMAEALSEAIRDHFGVDLDAETLRKGPAAFEDALKDALMSGRSEMGWKPRKKTAKQLAREEQERKAEEFAKKSLRSLYLSLVKVLHPDAELDDAEKHRKEKIMKELTTAHEAGDLHTLLRIEKEWIAREATNPEPLAEDKLKVYTLALKEQAEELEGELASLDYSPRFAPIHEYLDLGAAWAEARIREAVRNEKTRLKLLRDLILAFTGKMEKQTFIQHVRQIAEE